MIAGGFRISGGAWMTRAACPVDFTRGNARQPDVWALCAPDRPVAVIDSRGCAVERLASGDDGSGEQERDNHPALLPSLIDLRSPSGVVHHKHAPAEDRFTRHAKLSEDLKFFEIKVDQSNKARMHGVILGSVFYLVWLDRLHAVYPE